MSFPTISNTELNNVGATTLPNQPTISATALKQKFDEPAKNLIAPKFNNLVSELQTGTAAADLGAVSPPNRAAATTVQGVMNNISSDLDDAILDVANLQVESHSHPNKAVIDELTDVTGELYYNGNPIGETDYDELDNRPAINGNTLTGDMSTSDIGITIPTDLADLADDSTHRLVTDTDMTSWNGKIENGVKNIKVGAKTIVASGEDTIELKPGANVTITADTTDNSITITSTGGGGGGGGDMYKSVYDDNSDGVVNAADEATTITGLTATVSELNTLDGITADVNELNVLDGITASTSQLNWTAKVQETTPADGELLTYDSTASKWKNKAPDKSLARYGGSKTFSELTSALLVAANEDKFFLCTDGGTIAQADQANWILPYGSVIPPDSHIAVVNTGTELSPVYQFDDFGGYVDISGKADKTELPTQITRSGVTVAAGSDVRIPSYPNTNSAITTSSTIVPVCDKGDNTAAKYSSIAVHTGYVQITMAEALSNATVGIIVFND